MNRIARQHVAAVRRGKAPPGGGSVLWNAFCHLSAARTWHTHGPNPISYQDIAAYCHLMRCPLEPRHIAILRAMDAEWMKPVVGQTSAQPVRAGAPLSPALFDAVFGHAG